MSICVHLCPFVSISSLIISFTSFLEHVASNFFLYGLKSRVHSFEIQIASLFDNFFIENIVSIFVLHFKQNHMHPGFPIALFSQGLNFQHLMHYKFPQYFHSSILSFSLVLLTCPSHLSFSLVLLTCPSHLSFSLVKIFSQSSHFQGSLPSLPDSEFLLPPPPPRVTLFFSFAIGALQITTFSPVSCFGTVFSSFSLISVIPQKIKFHI